MVPLPLKWAVRLWDCGAGQPSGLRAACIVTLERAGRHGTAQTRFISGRAVLAHGLRRCCAGLVKPEKAREKFYFTHSTIGGIARMLP